MFLNWNISGRSLRQMWVNRAFGTAGSNVDGPYLMGLDVWIAECITARRRIPEALGYTEVS